MDKLADAIATERFRTTLKLFSAGVDLQRQKLRRTFPGENVDQIEIRLRQWLSRSGEPGDAPGRTVTLQERATR
jgi:hypothetical protein